MYMTVYHVTVLSNFPRAYDKYKAHYNKAQIPESSFPGKFFVLRRNELSIGLKKAGKLLARLAVDGNRLLILESRVSIHELYPNVNTGLGHYLESDTLPVQKVYYWNDDETLTELSVEQAMADALMLNLPQMQAYTKLRPRSLSVLPVPLACQANCQFCFSKASVSMDTELVVPSHLKLNEWLERAKVEGAERFVITGGGEPGLIKHAALVNLIRQGAAYFSKTVLITNGIHLAKRSEPVRQEMMQDYAEAGLAVLAVSRHHHSEETNSRIMGVETNTSKVLETWRTAGFEARPARLRLICVLQKGGIETVSALREYVTWAVSQGVSELCFKELYVSTTKESLYHTNPENDWSRANQVSLALVSNLLEAEGFLLSHRLPWGAPVYKGIWDDKEISIAAYTEPSLFWERTAGVARSWNLMADNKCFASLEDPKSRLASESSYKTFEIKAST